MFVGMVEMEMSIPGADCLKAKRSVLRKVVERTRSRFPVSIAETDLQDKWQRAKVGFAVVSNEPRHVHSIVDQIIHFIEELYVVSLIDVRQRVTPFTPTDEERRGFSFD
jgi:uncharacterized protein